MTINVGQRGEIVIPKQVRQALGIRAGSTVNLIIEGEEARIVPGETNVVEVLERIAQKGGLGITTYDADTAYDAMMEDQQEHVHRH